VDRHEWDTRYAGEELVWTSTPNQFLVSEVAGLSVGRAVDLACGEGRNAVWLAEQGWRVTGVDFSPVGLAKGRQLAESRNVDVQWVESAMQEWSPPPERFDLVAVFYLQLPQPERSAALKVAASAVAPGGTMLVVAHDHDNLTRGYGGPPNDTVLYSVSDVTTVAEAAGLVVQRAEQVVRQVETDGGVRQAIDTLVRANRPA
jgi:2-polyprenyl-3-methyl-5-hydroxy-6-metoxy-1,4-benzoquinol methylase